MLVPVAAFMSRQCITNLYPYNVGHTLNFCGMITFHLCLVIIVSELKN